MPEPQFADDAENLAVAHGQIDALDRAHHPRRVANSTVRSCTSSSGRSTGRVHVRRTHVRRLGSTMSRSPSPRRLKQNTAAMSVQAGEQRDPPLAGQMIPAAPSATMIPHSRRGRPDAESDERQSGGVQDRDRPWSATSAPP